jgi:hypothetical protein
VLIQERLDAGLGPAVDAKRFVVGADNNPLGAESNVLQKDARAWVLLPVKGSVGVAFTFHFVTFQSVDLFRSDMRVVVNGLLSMFCLNIFCSLARSLSMCIFSFSVS